MTLEADITGQKFGNLTAIRRVANKGSQICWLFRCDCGSEKEIRKHHVVHGITKTCKCNSSALGEKYWDSNLFVRWRNMKTRCYNIKDKSYPNYGGRGIYIVEEWSDFGNFRDWAMASGYSRELQIDRIDNDGPYAPWNCRWITIKDNSRNKRNSRLVHDLLDRRHIATAAEQGNLNQGTVASRYIRGDRGGRLTRPVGKYTVFGERGTLKHFSEKYKIGETTIRGRLRRGFSIEEALTLDRYAKPPLADWNASQVKK